MPSNYAAIATQNRDDYRRRVTQYGKVLLQLLYSDRTHFIFELLQNAEDAGALQISFRLYPTAWKSTTRAVRSTKRMFAQSAGSLPGRRPTISRRLAALGSALSQSMRTRRHPRFIQKMNISASATMSTQRRFLPSRFHRTKRASSFHSTITKSPPSRRFERSDAAFRTSARGHSCSCAMFARSPGQSKAEHVGRICAMRRATAPHAGLS